MMAESHVQAKPKPAFTSTPLQRPIIQTTASRVNEDVVHLEVESPSDADVHADQYATISAAAAAVEHVEVPRPVVIDIEVADITFVLLRNATYPSHWSVPVAYP